MGRSYRARSVAIGVATLAVMLAAVGAACVAGRWAGLGAALLAGALFQPVHRLARRAADRLLDGRTADVRALAATARQRLQQGDPHSGLRAILALLCAALPVTGAAVELDDHVVQTGTLPATATSVSLERHGEPVGRLLLGAYTGRGAPGRVTTRVLAALLPALADAAHAVRLAGTLQREHERASALRAQERRRLGRDLHDGLGQSLSGLAMSIHAARLAARTAPEQAEALFMRLLSAMEEVTIEVGRLVDGAPPPQLAELGLLKAIEALVGSPLSSGGGDLEGLPPAVELAVYRIVQEAVTNAHRHAAATSVTVAVERCQDRLLVRVRDDGRGLPAQPPAGIGLRSMRERAAELGGCCVIRHAEGGGTIVEVDLPL
ncbi:sensor histidine kinase [Nonomuraea endophytica]|uniref:Oxygen sensor histidine kinase NreB n=1 Tax=Nonomuraea endophytica TaxID=714136 RepID=A0A7W8AEI4_9ACTN|nr:sensor histidine kinase [Nonomuraea endophytica]MBB5084199.1 signal transduction histidine kinase [Nonomuraea endophytica]